MPTETRPCRSECPIANALDIVGDRWTLVLMRDLMFRNLHEYKEFLESPEGIATNILSARLKSLTEDGIIKSIPHPTNGTKKLYYLTEKGKTLMPLLIEITLWGTEQIPNSAAPPEVISAMRTNRELFSQQMLEILNLWEEEYLRATL
ncbi:MAG: helix-turn-helix domain-containing protein [Verrucomicrobia bacterium]|nr:helix-turn-helix domain-containing protein [Verrucomicrobiota bacterium]MDA1069414.1 helix-turn-helix domain-containing protein [Verrucomicrobiota bacterium]